MQVNPLDKQPASSDIASTVVKPGHTIRNVCITIVILIVVSGGLLFVLANVATLFLSNGCDAKTAKMQQLVDTSQAKLNNLRIDGQAPFSVEAYPDGDCLTGNGAIATATVGIMSSDLKTAHSRLTSSIVPQEISTVAEFVPKGADGSPQISLLETTLRANSNEMYHIEYHLKSAIVCGTSGQPLCPRNYTEAVAMYDIANKPIDKVVITLNSSIDARAE